VEETIFQKLVNAMRAYNIRFMKFITEAHFDMNRSVLAGSNRGNQLNLCYEMNKKDPTMQYEDFVQSTFLTCIPGSSIIDAVIQREVDDDTGKKTCEGRFPWDTRMGTSSALPQYGRVCFLPKSKLDSTLRLAWFEDISIVGKLIMDVRCALEVLDEQVLLLRNIVFDKCFPELKLSDNDSQYKLVDIRNGWKHFHTTFSKNDLLQREGNESEMSAYLQSTYTFSFDNKCKARYVDGRKIAMSHVLEQFGQNFMNLVALVVSKQYLYRECN